MERDRPRWRIRISTLMLLVIIAALASALVVERWKRTVEAQRALADGRGPKQRLVRLWRSLAGSGSGGGAGP